MFTFVTGPGCHLCAHGRGVLERLGARYVEVEVGSGEALALAEAGVSLALLPVLVGEGRLVAYGRFSERRLARELAG